MGKLDPVITIDHHFTKDISYLYRSGICSYRINPARIGIERSSAVYEILAPEASNLKIFFDTLGSKARIGLKDKIGILKRKVVISTQASNEIDIVVPDSFFDYILEGDRLMVKGITNFYIDIVSKLKEKVIGNCNIENIVVKDKAHIYIKNRYIRNENINSTDSEIIEKFSDKGIIALSFVDSVELLQKVQKMGHAGCKIYAKIESPEGIKSLKEIAQLSDGVIIGRDDLSIFYSEKEIQDITLMCIKQCNSLGKECIPASNLFLSLIENEEISKSELIYLKRLTAEGVKRVYCNETVTCNNKNIAKKILCSCQKVV